MTYVIAQPCVDLLDKACIEECPVDCIYEGKRMLYIHPDECVDCGACEPVCPVEAIFYEDDTPEQWKDYYKANVEFFDDLGSPGGAAKMGKIDKDHPLIAALPPQEQDAPLSPSDAAGPGPVARPAAGLPLGQAGAATPTSAGPIRTASSTCRSARRWTPRRPSCRRALAAASDAPGYPQTHGTPALREAVASWFARRGRAGRRPRGGAADHRLQGDGGLAADAARARAPATSSCTPRWPTRRTTWARGWPAPPPWPPTA